MFTSKALRVFITLYEEKSLKTAAEKLCLTVPPVARMLKLTEEWLDEKLFIVERNCLIPTAAAQSFYQHLLPHYGALETFNHIRRGKGFHISSPQISTAIFTDLLNFCSDSLPPSSVLRYSETIRSDDDVFITLQQTTMPPYFEIFRTDLLLELQAAKEIECKWKEMPLLTEKSLELISHFQKVLSELRSRGFNGLLRQIDNLNLLNDAFLKGEGIMFRCPDPSVEGCCTLPFIFHRPLYVYINSIKKDERHEKFLSQLNKILP